jgi:aminoglycoside phosphotransferase
MKVIESGRLVLPAGAERARAFAADSLVTVHRRRDRLRTAIGGDLLGGEERLVDQSPAQLATDGILLGGVEDELIAAWLGRATEWVILRDYAGSERAKSLIFLFGAAEPNPFALVKIRAQASVAPRLERELEAIAAISERLPATLSSTMPKVLDYTRGSDAEVLVLAALPGRPIGISMQRSARPHASHRRHLESAGAWLGSFQRSTAPIPFRGTIDERTAVHGDLWPRNVLTAAESQVSGVIDWEAGAVSGPIWMDLFTFPLLFAMGPGEDAARGFRRAFLEESAARRAVDGYFDAYCATSGLPRGALRALFDEFAADSAGIAGKEGGWRASLDWASIRQAVALSNRSVFSG